MTDQDPAQWLRRRPERDDDAEEFLRDFSVWARAMLLQEGFNYGEFEYFCERATALSPAPRGAVRPSHDALSEPRPDRGPRCGCGLFLQWDSDGVAKTCAFCGAGS